MFLPLSFFWPISTPSAFSLAISRSLAFFLFSTRGLFSCVNQEAPRKWMIKDYPARRLADKNPTLVALWRSLIILDMKNKPKISVLLPASVERFCVSRMRGFYITIKAPSWAISEAKLLKKCKNQTMQCNEVYLFHTGVFFQHISEDHNSSSVPDSSL